MNMAGAGVGSRAMLAKEAYARCRLTRSNADFDRFLRSEICEDLRVNEYVLGCVQAEVDRQSVGFRLDPMEIADDLLLELLKKLPTIRDLRSFFYTAVWRRVRDHVRRARRERIDPTPEDEIVRSGPAAPDSAVENYGCTDEGPSQSETDQALHVAAALDQLKPAQRYVIIRHHFDGVSLPEIAEELGQIVNTVRVRHGRAQERLRNLLKSPR